MSDEAAFLSAIAARPDDPAARLIYADWLDEQSDPRGPALRALIEWQALPPGDPARAPLAEAMAALPIATEWLAGLTQAPIECCTDDGCPEQWQALPGGPNPSQKNCRNCGRTVEWCLSIIEARPKVWRGSPVVLDPRAVRRTGDLQPPDWDADQMAAIRLEVHRRNVRRRRRSGIDSRLTERLPERRRDLGGAE
ncbi:MAG TPA: TIGR02996 domain-containing protein [Pirellulales bacterium]